MMHGVLLDTSPNGTQWSAIAIALVVVAYLLFVRPLKRARKDPLARTPSEGRLARERTIEREMTHLLVEYEKMMRAMSSRLDTRIAKLEVLIRNADERLGALKALEGDARASAASRQATATRFVHSRPPTGAAEEQVRESPSPQPTDADATPTPPDADATPTPPDVAPRHGGVYALADQGLSCRQISRQLDRAYGEIELILALRDRQESVPASASGGDLAEDGTADEDTMPVPSTVTPGEG